VHFHDVIRQGIATALDNETASEQEAMLASWLEYLMTLPRAGSLPEYEGSYREPYAALRSGLGSGVAVDQLTRLVIDLSTRLMAST